MTALLSKAGKDLTVAMLLDALQQTKDFENSMARKFAVPVSPHLQNVLPTPSHEVSDACYP